MPLADASLQSRLLTALEPLRHLIGRLHDDLSRPAVDHAATTVPTDGPTPAPPPLYATFFGSFALYRAGERLPVDQTRACLELCRYLIGQGGRLVPREELLEVLWPKVD